MTDETTDMTTDKTTSHSTRLSKDNNQVAGYNPAPEKLLDGHPKDAGQIIGYSHSARLTKSDSLAIGYSRTMLLIAFFVGITFSLPVAAKLYKWVDDQGVTHYGETIPPEYANKDRSELNKSGREIKKIEVATPAERRAKEQADEKKKADDKAALEKKRHDLTLTNTYSNVKEIDLARNRNLQQVNARIINNTSQLKMAKDNLQGLQNEADGYSKAKKRIPDSLQVDLQESQARVDKMQLNLEKSLTEKAAVEARYDADKARYKELTGK